MDVPAPKIRGIASILAVIAIACLPAPSPAKTYDIGTDATAEFKEAQILENPEPKIPPELQQDSFKSSCEARFAIAVDGKTKVKLLTSSGSDEIDDITLATLRRWKFKPAMLDGKPVSSSRRIKVEYDID